MRARHRIIALAAVVLTSLVGYTSPAHAATTTVNGGSQILHYSVSNATFYPYHRDGYKDVAKFSFWIDDTMTGATDDNDCATATPDYEVSIKNQYGNQVRWIGGIDNNSYSIAGPWYSATPQVLTWNGKKDDGTMVKAGQTFSADIFMEADCNGYTIRAGATLTGIKPVFGTKIVHKTLTKRGRYSSSHTATGSCFSRPDGYDWWLDCTGSSGVGQVTYTFTMPKHSTFRSWNWDGNWNGPDRGDTKTINGRTVTIRIGTATYAWQDIQHVWINFVTRVPI